MFGLLGPLLKKILDTALLLVIRRKKVVIFYVLVGLSAFKPQCSAEPRFSDSDMRFSEHNKNLTLDFEMSVTLIVFKTLM
ncbi:hypothetical protein M8J77_005789 [Diaphorina citri]|nr:hypothetical protein M8J77_005789 [Diaphorina citri]